MIEKRLQEAAWKELAVKLDVKGTELMNALGLLHRADAKGPQDVLDALDVVEKHVDAQVKECADADKPLLDKLGKMRTAVELQRKTSGSELKAARKAAEDEAQAAADEEDDTPALLTNKMVPVLRELKKGKVRMHAVVCTAGKATAVLIMRRAFGASKNKLLAEAVDAKGGMKYIRGECLFEDGAVVFVVASAAAGLAKRTRQALLDQTELRLKVKVRVAGGADEEDGEDGGEDQVGIKPVSRKTEPPRSPEYIAYTKRLRKLKEPLEQALSKRHPESTKLRALLTFAEEKAGDDDAVRKPPDFAAATQALAKIEALLAATAAGPDMKALRDAWAGGAKSWLQAIGAASKSIGTLQKKVLESEDPRAREIARGLEGALKRMPGREQIGKQLQLMADAAAKQDTGKADALRANTRVLVKQCQTYLSTDSLVADIDSNPFHAVDFRRSVDVVLKALEPSLR